MKKIEFFLLALVTFYLSHSQPIRGVMTPAQGDSLKRCLQTASNDTVRLQTLGAVAEYYAFVRQDSAIYYITKKIELAEKVNYTYHIFAGYARLSFILNTLSNYPKALEMALRGLKIAEQLKSKRKESIAECYHMIGLLNNRMGNDSIGLQYCLQSIRLFKESGVPDREINFGAPGNATVIYLKWHRMDSALFYAKMSHDIALHYQDADRIHLAATASGLARTYEALQDVPRARQYYLMGLNTIKQYIPSLLTVRYYNVYARFLQKTGDLDSCLYYAQTALQLCQNKNFGEHATDAASILSRVYESRQMPDSALKYLKVMLATRDTIINQSKSQQVFLLNFDEGQRQKDITAARERYVNQVKFYSSICAAGILLLISLILYRNNRNKQRANALLQSQKVEIEEQRSKAEQALDELRVTQKQLIQSEKMASLGELTAGIAHEIQNPLNFVNNFSDVNRELIEELKSEKVKDKSERNDELEMQLLDDIEKNLEKISHHGRRADAIVKGMLQHSRTGSGLKEPTDINRLADEYLRLAYQGFRARDKSFNATFSTEFDNDIDKVDIVPQEIGRVILNLINNAFYAVNERSKQGIPGYEPTVTVGTRRLQNRVEISVKDNGNGIPGLIKEKIFQPFFTTKPTGQGTGLGLSLAYDIVKAHGGEIKVETSEGEGSEFIIQLPVL